MSPAAMRCLPNQRVMSAPVCSWCAANAVTRTWIWYAILVKSTLLCPRARQRRFHSLDLWRFAFEVGVGAVGVPG